MTSSKYLQYIKNVLPCIYCGAICGCVTGIVIFLFRLCAKYIEGLSVMLYKSASLSAGGCICAVLICALAGLLMYFLHKKMPEIKGGGIPRSEGILRGLLPSKHLRTFIGTVIGSFMSFMCGVPVGSEGPAVLIGTSLGGMCSRFSKKRYAIDRYVMSGGAGAGFAVATGAPLSALLFTLEEIHKRFTPTLVMTVSSSVLCAATVNEALCILFGTSPKLFSFTVKTEFAVSDIGYLLLLGVFTALAVGIFDKSIHLFKRFSKLTKDIFPAWSKLVILFGTVALIGLFLSNGIYSGHHVIEEVYHSNEKILVLVLILAIRLGMMLFVTDCGATGGIFIPTLAIGVLFGAISSRILMLAGLPSEFGFATTLLGMCAFLGGTLRAPFTACILFAELTGQFTDFFYIAATVFTVNLITELLGQVPFYDMVLEHTVKKQNKNTTAETAYFRMTVQENSFVCGKAVKDVMWPYFCVVLSVEHKTDFSDKYFNDGEKVLHAGDVIIVRIKFSDESIVKSRLCALTGGTAEKATSDLPDLY